ncbi:exodeoxyribonuclease VII small subunit [Plesiocystis pacifica SIR-1]|uniref:Exodeoxyribonuclease 7 small subunit n=1 Tax=Plesiocystis pacifica SIR-1 TaxID=391625 RepID=A6GKD9_9BACT|nr:exodeoxyribonuclease VII small subunit [Plesiocystis pacifica]EDM73659.1 exodeoxyribonuclease VII small subunit [Plesiocystis pacifica SIR-1]
MAASSKSGAKSGSRRRKSPKTAEALLARLDEVVRGLEGGDLPLEKALASFEEGVALVREGEEMLASVEQRIEMLLADGGVVPFGEGRGAAPAEEPDAD